MAGSRQIVSEELPSRLAAVCSDSHLASAMCWGRKLAGNAEGVRKLQPRATPWENNELNLKRTLLRNKTRKSNDFNNAEIAVLFHVVDDAGRPRPALKEFAKPRMQRTSSSTITPKTSSGAFSRSTGTTSVMSGTDSSQTLSARNAGAPRHQLKGTRRRLSCC